MVYEHFREDNGGSGFNVVSPADFNDWHQRTHGFADMAAWLTTDFDLAGEHAELPEVVQGAGGSWNLFSVLGTPPAMGRAFRPEEDQVGSQPCSSAHVELLPKALRRRRLCHRQANKAE